MKKTTVLCTLLFGSAALWGPSLQAQDINVVELWAKNCKKCHGADGKGQTRAGQKLKVVDYTDPAVQATFTDEEAIQITADGAVNEETGEEIMKPMKDKLSHEEIVALVAYVRAFAASE